MRVRDKLILACGGIIILAGGLLLAGGYLSIPRDYTSPAATIRVVDQHGAPISGIEVGRYWYDSDAGTEGDDDSHTDEQGYARFPKIPANVGLLTGTWRKLYTTFGMCGSGHGTQTTISVRYPGRYDVRPQGKPLHPVGASFQDSNGVWFQPSVDSGRNTLIHLVFPSQAEAIDYALSSTARP